MSNKGYPSQEKNDRLLPAQFATVQPTAEKRHGLDVNANMYHQIINDGDLIDAVLTDKEGVYGLNVDTHGALKGHLVRFRTGNSQYREIKIQEIVDVDNFTLAETITDNAPVATDEVDILRPTQPRCNDEGDIVLTSGPLLFTLDGADQAVTEDTGVPGNNRPLPVKLTDVTGDINITAGDLNVQLSHAGATPDSVQIGDGAETLAINASNEATVNDADANTKLTAIQTAVEIIDNAIAGTEMQVDLVDLGGAATEVTLAALEAKLGALGQAASAGSAPVVLSTEQEVILTAIQTAVEVIDNAIAGAQMQVDLVGIADVATETTLAALSAKLGALGQAASAASAPVVLSTEQEVILTAIRSAVELLDNAISGSEMQVDLVDIGGVATESTLGDISTDTGNIDGKLPAALGQTTSGASLAVVPASDYVSAGRTPVEFERHDYSSTTVTTAAYTELIASTSGAANIMEIFDSSGQTLVIAFGAAASESDQFLVFPGGNGKVEVAIPAATRISIKAISANADAGEISINLYN